MYVRQHVPSYKDMQYLIVKFISVTTDTPRPAWTTKKHNIQTLGPNAHCPTCERILGTQHTTLINNFITELKTLEKHLWWLTAVSRCFASPPGFRVLPPLFLHLLSGSSFPGPPVLGSFPSGHHQLVPLVFPIRVEINIIESRQHSPPLQTSRPGEIRTPQFDTIKPPLQPLF